MGEEGQGMNEIIEERPVKYKFRDEGKALSWGADPPPLQGVRELLGDEYTDDLEWAFPDVVPGIYPCGMFILVQLAFPKKRKKLPNGNWFYYADESVTADKARTQTALVRAFGPVAYRNRETLVAWPEGAWCRPGKFIRTPMYGGDRIAVPVPGRDPSDEALFVIFRDQDCLSVITGDPLSIKVG